MNVAGGNDHLAELVGDMNYLTVNIFEILNRLEPLIAFVLTSEHKRIVAVRLNFKIVIKRRYSENILVALLIDNRSVKLAGFAGASDNKSLTILHKPVTGYPRSALEKFQIGIRYQLVEIFKSLSIFCKYDYMICLFGTDFFYVLVGNFVLCAEVVFAVKIIVVNEVALHAVNDLDSCLCGCVARFREGLDNSVIGYCNRLVSPCRRTAYKLLCARHTVHCRHICMQVKLHPFFGGVVLLFDFFNLRDRSGIDEICVHIGVHIDRASDKNSLSVLEVFNKILALLLFTEHLYRVGRGVVGNVEIDDTVSAVLGLPRFE